MTRVRLTEKYRQFLVDQGIDPENMTLVVPKMHEYKEQMQVSSPEDIKNWNDQIEAKKLAKKEKKHGQDNSNTAKPLDT